MQQPLRQNKYMSTKDIYFLPIIHDPRLALTKKIEKNMRKSKSKQRSLQEILHDKTNLSNKLEASLYQNSILRKTALANNLYNKYDEIPKIFAKINRKKLLKNQVVDGKRKTYKNIIEDHVDQNEPIETKVNEQSCFSFDSSFYKQDFNKKLQKQIEKIQFSLQFNFSHNTMLMVNQLLDDTPSPIHLERRPKKKFTKMDTTEDESQREKQLKRVPSFLMKLLDSCKPIQSQQ